MKKIKLDPAKTQPLPKQSSPAAQSTQKLQQSSGSATQKAPKKSKLLRQIEELTSKINESTAGLQEQKKAFDPDSFLKKQKQKQLNYSKQLNEQYEKNKKERENKLYKAYHKENELQKLPTGTFKSEIPLNIFGAVEQIELSNNNLKKWTLDGHHHKIDELLFNQKKEELFGQDMKIAEQQCLKSKEDNSWRRAKEVANNSAQITYFPVKIQENQLQPSDFGQSLMSVLTLMPQTLSQYLYHEVQNAAKDKYFMLRFYPGGLKKTLLTNQWLEVHQLTHKYINVSSRNKNNLFFWSSLLEKAFKKLYFKQQLPISLAQTFQTIYGIDPEFIPLSNKITIKENFPKILSTLIHNHPKALIGFINEKSDTCQRIYPLIDVLFPPDLPQKKKKHKENSPPVSTDILYHVSNPYSGNLLSSTYINKFTINELYQKFTKLVVLRQLPKKWTGTRIFIEFLSNGPISFTGSNWTQNNQYSFTLIKSTQTRIALRRRWGSYIDSSQNEQNNIFGFMLFKSQAGQTEVKCLKLQSLVQKVKSTDQSGCVLDCKLEKGTYILLPYSHRVSQQYMQLMILDIFVEWDQILSVNKSRMNEYYYQTGNAKDDKVLQKLQIKTKYEKPKCEKLNPQKLLLPGEQTINIKVIEGMGLTLMKNATCQDYFIPGKLKLLLTSGEIKQAKAEKKIMKSAQEQQIERYEKEQALKTLLGYDILMGEDINYGEMKHIVEQTSDEIDLSNYELGQQGLMALLQPLMLLPRITKLNLSFNSLNDSIITYLCYYLQKGNRNQLRELDLKGNSIGKMGKKALEGLSKTFQQLKIIGLKQ